MSRLGYWLTMAGMYFLVGGLMFYSGKGKLFDDDGKAPEPLAKQFEGTFIDTFPGVDTAWVILGIMELGVVVLLVLSLLRRELAPKQEKTVLLAALGLAMLTFACLSFGQTTTGNTEGSASLFGYFGATVVTFLLVLKLPPNGRPDWL